MKRIIFSFIVLIMLLSSCRNLSSSVVDTQSISITPSLSTSIPNIKSTPSPKPPPTTIDPWICTEVAKSETVSAVETARATILQRTPEITATSAWLVYWNTVEAEWELKKTEWALITPTLTPDPPYTPTVYCITDEECFMKSTAVEREFYEAFRVSIINEDRESVAAAVVYPRIQVINGRYTLIESEEEFLKYYELIIDDEVKTAVINQHFSESMEMGSKGWMVDYGTIWFTKFCDDADCKNPYAKITGITSGSYPDDSVLTQTPPANTIDNDLYGTWAIVDIKETAPPGEWYPFPNIEQYLGAFLTIEPGAIHLFGQTCTFDSLFHRVVEAEEYFYEVHSISIHGLGILNQKYVGIIETGCAGVPVWTIVVQNDNRIFIPMEEMWSTYYLELERIE